MASRRLALLSFLLLALTTLLLHQACTVLAQGGAGTQDGTVNYDYDQGGMESTHEGGEETAEEGTTEGGTEGTSEGAAEVPSSSTASTESTGGTTGESVESAESEGATDATSQQVQGSLGAEPPSVADAAKMDNPDAQQGSGMEDNSAGAAFPPGNAPPGFYAKYNFTTGWDNVKKGEFGPEAIIGTAIGAVFGMSLCICMACICYIRQRNIARAQYGPPGGQIEL